MAELTMLVVEHITTKTSIVNFNNRVNDRNSIVQCACGQLGKHRVNNGKSSLKKDQLDAKEIKKQVWLEK